MNVNQLYKSLRMIHFALLLGSVIFAFLQYGFVVDFSLVAFNGSSIYLYVLLIQSTIFLFIDRFFFAQGKKNAIELKNMKEKWDNYQTTKIRSWAFYEGLILVSIAFLSIEPNAFFMIFTFAFQFILILNRPSLTEAKNDFNFDNLEA